MERTFTIFFLWCFSFTCSAQWMEVDPGIDVDYFTDVYAVSQNVAIVVGTDGTIIKTTDGGDTWLQKESGTNEILSDVQFPSAEIGFIIGGNGTFLKTIDGGETWTSIDGICAGVLSCVNENLIFVRCSGSLYKSTDGGENWIETINAPDILRMQFVNDSKGFAGNYLWENNDWENPYIFITNNGGISWETVSGVAPFHFLDENLGYYYLGGLHKTTDSGNTFEQLTIGQNELFTLADIYALNENTIWGIIFLSLLDGDTSSRGFMKISSTDSETYEEVQLWDSDPDLNFNSIHFANETLGYAVGSRGDWPNRHGIIWRNGNGINEPMNTKELENLDFQVYPNPTSSELNIMLTNSNTKLAQVELSDLSGKKIFRKDYSNEKNIKIDVKSFSKGTYVLTVNKQSQKIIIK